MDGQTHAPPTRQVIWILYGALLFSQLIFIFVFENFIYTGEAAGGIPNIVTIFASIGLILAFISNKMYKKALTDKISDDQLMAVPGYKNSIEMIDPNKIEEFKESYKLAYKQTYYILSWALGEAITIFGLAGYFLGIDKPVNYFFFATGILLHLYHRPKFKS